MKATSPKSDPTTPGAVEFPPFIVCHQCGARRRVIKKEICEMPEGVAGVAWARCRKCHHMFVRFIGERRPAARLMRMWLGIRPN